MAVAAAAAVPVRAAIAVLVTVDQGVAPHSHGASHGVSYGRNVNHGVSQISVTATVTV